jgi:hypothetical protein
MKAGRLFAIASAITVLATTAHASITDIQNLAAGARAASLGNAFVAVADNGDAVFANPAGLSQIESRQLAYTNMSMMLGGIDGDDLGRHLTSFVQPLGEKLALGLGYARNGSELFNENGAFASMSYRLNRTLSLGLTAKYLFWSVGEIPDDNGVADPLSNKSHGAPGVDVGLLWKSPLRGAHLGLLLKDLNQPNSACGTKCSKDAVLEPDAGKLPMDVHIGIAAPVAETSMVSVQWVMRDLGGETERSLVIGGETRLVEGLMLRAGGSRILEEDVSGDLNAGLGYRWNKMLFDYGYHIPLELTETNGSHRFTLNYRL